MLSVPTSPVTAFTRTYLVYQDLSSSCGKIVQLAASAQPVRVNQVFAGRLSCESIRLTKVNEACGILALGKVEWGEKERRRCCPHRRLASLVICFTCGGDGGVVRLEAQAQAV